MSRERGRFRSLLGPTLLVAAAIAAAQLGTYLLNVVAARSLGPTAFGELASLLGVLAIGNVVALAVQAVTARRIVLAPTAERPHAGAALLRSAVAFGVGVAAALVVVLPLLRALLHLDGAAGILLVALALMPLTVIGGVLGVAQGHERPRPLAAAYFLAGSCKALGGIAGVLIVGTVDGTLALLAVGSAVGLVLSGAAVRHQVARPAAALPGLTPEVLHAGHALLALFVLTNVDLLLARHFLPAAQAGLYAAGGIVVKVAFWLPQAIIVVAFPGMADARRGRTVVWGAATVSALGLIVVAMTWAFSGQVLAVVGGAAYAALQPMLWAFALAGAVESVAQFLLYSRLAVEDRRAVVVVWTTVAALVLLVWVGPHETPAEILRAVVAVVGALCLVGGALVWRERRAALPVEVAQMS